MTSQTATTWASFWFRKLPMSSSSFCTHAAKQHMRIFLRIIIRIIEHAVKLILGRDTTRRVAVKRRLARRLLRSLSDAAWRALDLPVEAKIEVANPHRWDLDTPYLYSVASTLGCQPHDLGR